MKKEYEKPLIEVIDFKLLSNIMDAELGGNPGDLSTDDGFEM